MSADPDMSPYKILILAAQERIQNTLNGLNELLREAGDAQEAGVLLVEFLKGNPEANIQLIEDFFSSPVFLDDGADAEQLSNQILIAMRSLFLTFNGLVLADRHCADALTAESDSLLASGIYLVWDALANAELERGKFLGMKRGYNIKGSDIATAIKAARSKQGRKGADAKLANDKKGKQAAKAKAKEACNAWQNGTGDKFSGNDDFGLKMVALHEALTSPRVVSGWAAEWRKERNENRKRRTS